MGCKSLERESSQKTYLEIEGESQSKTQNEPFVLLRFGKSMFDNDTYNLMEQLEIENRSLWRIKNSYKKDDVTDNETKRLWSLIEKEKEKIVKLLTEKVRERL